MAPEIVSQLPMHRPVILDTNANLKQAAQAMAQNEVGSVLVANQTGHLVGVVTDRDLALALTLHELNPSDAVSTLIQGEVVCAYADQPINELIGIFQKHAVRRLPVMTNRSDRNTRCIGVISVDDLIKAKLITIEELSSILKAQLPPPSGAGRLRLKRLFSTQDNRQQVAHEFVQNIARRTGLSDNQAKSLMLHLFGALLHRVPPASGRKFLSQLPQDIQRDLQPELEHEGIDRSLTANLLIEAICQRLSVDEAETQRILRGFWNAVSEKITAGDLSHFVDHLPKKMQVELELPLN